MTESDLFCSVPFRSDPIRSVRENHDYDSDDNVIREAEGRMPALPGVQAGTKLQSDLV